MRSTLPAPERFDACSEKKFQDSYASFEAKNPLVEVMRFFTNPYKLIDGWKNVVKNPGIQFPEGFLLDAPSSIKAPGKKLVSDTCALIVDIGGTNTKVGYLKTDSNGSLVLDENGEPIWEELFEVKNELLKPKYLDPNANLYEVYLESLFKYIKENSTIDISKVARLSVVWSNAIDSYELSGEVAGTGGRFPKKAIFSKGEWFAPSIKEGDDLSIPVISAAIKAGMKLEKFLIMNDTIATAAARAGSWGGSINSTGTNGTLITKDGIYTNPEMGVGLYVTEEYLTSADKRAFEEKRLDFISDEVKKIEKNEGRAANDKELKNIRTRSETEVHATLQDLAGGSTLFFARSFKYAVIDYLNSQGYTSTEQLYLFQELAKFTGEGVCKLVAGDFSFSSLRLLGENDRSFIQTLADGYFNRSFTLCGIMSGLSGISDADSTYECEDLSSGFGNESRKDTSLNSFGEESRRVVVNSTVALGYEKLLGTEGAAEELIQSGADIVTGAVIPILDRGKTATPMLGAGIAVLAA